MQVQIGEREVDDQAMCVLRDAAIADFRKPEDPLDDVEHMLHSGSHPEFVR